MKEISDELYNKLSYLGIIQNDVRSYNVGDSNYSEHLIQPWTIWLDYPELTAFDDDIIKRVLRTKKTDSRDSDYEKIIHICKERIRQLKCEEHKDDGIIKRGDRFRCIESVYKTFNPYGKSDFEAEFEYQSYKEGSLESNFGISVDISSEELKKHFKRIK